MMVTEMRSSDCYVQDARLIPPLCNMRFLRVFISYTPPLQFVYLLYILCFYCLILEDISKQLSDVIFGGDRFLESHPSYLINNR